jgi:hypothetical protein
MLNRAKVSLSSSLLPTFSNYSNISPFLLENEEGTVLIFKAAMWKVFYWWWLKPSKVEEKSLLIDAFLPSFMIWSSSEVYSSKGLIFSPEVLFYDSNSSDIFRLPY